MVRAKASARKSPAAGSSKEAKINDQVEVYRKEMCAKAQALLESTIPNKLEFLCQLLQGEKWQSDYRQRSTKLSYVSIVLNAKTFRPFVKQRQSTRVLY